MLAPASKTYARLSANAKGALWMFASAVSFTLMAVCLKLLAQRGYSESQMVFFRCAAGFLVIVPFALRAGARALKVTRPGPVFMRSFWSTLGFFAGFYAFAHMPLADAQAISFSRTLFVVVFAAWLLKEMVRWRRWAAVAVGFGGVLLMLQPQGGELSLAALAALASAVLFGLAIVTVKDLTRDHSTLALVFYTNAVTTVVGLPFAFFAWKTPDLSGLALLLALGFTGVAAQSCYVRALGLGDASLMGLIDYVRLPLAMLFGLLLFAEMPTAAALMGAAIVIGSTLYITWRESQIKVTRPPDPTDART